MKTRSPIDRVRFGAVILTAVFVLAVTGFCVFGGYAIVDAIWMVVVTISSVGFGEKSSFNDPMKLFTVAVIILGMGALAYTLGGVVQLIVGGELQRAREQRRMIRDINDLQNHVILCGFGRVGQILAEDLTEHKRKFVIIDNDEAAHEQAELLGYLTMVGDAIEDATLMCAGIDRAGTIVTGLPEDANNVFITLTARSLNPNIQIIARAAHPTTEGKLRQAGADRIVMPSVIGAERITRLITRPSTADLISYVYQRGFEDLELDEVFVPEDSVLVGKTIRETNASADFRLLIVAIQAKDTPMVFNPHADEILKANDTVLVMGHVDGIERFRAKFQL